MSQINHSLYADFPEQHNLINKLKLENADFAQLASEYHKLDHQVRGLENANIPTTDEVFSGMKRQRSILKDQLYSMIKMH